MANIPLVQVPNAPQTGNTAVMTDPSAIRTPNFRRGGAIIAEGVNMLRQEKLPAAAFDAGGMGAGLEALGNAGSNAAAAFGDFAVRLGRANDEAQMVTLDDIKSDVVSKFEEKALTTPADQLEPLWRKFDAEFADRANKLPMSSPLGTSKRDAAIKSMRLNMAAEVRGKAYKSRVESYRQTILNFAERARLEGRPEDAMAAYKRGVVSNLWTDEFAEQEIIKLEEEQKVNTMTQAIQQNPAQWRKELAKYQNEGKNPHGLRPEQVLQFRRMAEGTHAQLLDDLNNEMIDRLETGSVAITNDQIEEFYKRPEVDAPRELINKLKEYRNFKYADTPEGKADKATSYSDLWQAIFSYDAETDISMADPDTHKREYQKLQQRIIESAPEGERKPFLDTLNDMVSQASQGQKSRADEIVRGLMQQTDKLAEWGQFGQTGDWKKEKRGDVEVTVPKDVNAWLNVQSKRLEVTNEIRRLMRENPDLTVEQAQERFKGIVEPYLDPAASFMQKPEEEEGWQKVLWDVATWGDFVMNPTANNPNVMAAGISWGSRSLTEGIVDADEPLPPVQAMPPTADDEVASSGKRPPASIRNNNAGAMWPAKWQKKFGGEFGENLADGKGNKIARFPTKVQGAAATMYLLGDDELIYAKRTVRDGIKTWSNASGSSLRAYINAFEKAGFSADERIGDIMTDPQRAIAFTKAMSKFEAGREFPMSDEEWRAAFAMFREQA